MIDVFSPLLIYAKEDLGYQVGRNRFSNLGIEVYASSDFCCVAEQAVSAAVVNGPQQNMNICRKRKIPPSFRFRDRCVDLKNVKVASFCFGQSDLGRNQHRTLGVIAESDRACQTNHYDDLSDFQLWPVERALADPDRCIRNCIVGFYMLLQCLPFRMSPVALILDRLTPRPWKSVGSQKIFGCLPTTIRQHLRILKDFRIFEYFRKFSFCKKKRDSIHQKLF